MAAALIITERKQAEAALQQAEEKYRSIFENIDEGLFQTTPNGRYLSANPALARIYGYSDAEELIACLKNISQQLYVDKEGWAKFLALMQAQDRVSNFKSQVYRKDGSVIWVMENAHVVMPNVSRSTTKAALFDHLTQKHGLEKIKTIGDAYMVVGGLPTPRPDHAEAVVEMALDMQQAITRFQRNDGEPFDLRIGINSGPVVAGVIGTKKFAYDLWGDTVNVASRMESQGVAGSIQVTTATYKLLKDKYVFEERDAIAVKGKGEMITYWLIGKKVYHW